MKVFGYIRVSTEEQEKGFSLEFQEQTIRDYCEKHNLDLVKIFKDTSSGAQFDRPELQELLSSLDRVDKVIVWKMDRLSRSVKDTIRIMEIFEEKGKELISISEPFLSVTGDGKTKLMIHLFSSFAQYERDLIRERMMTGKIEKARRGLVPAGRSAYGYRYKNGTFEIIEEEAKIVKLIFEKYIELKTLGQVVRYLNQNGFRNQSGKPWKLSSVKSIITNPIYTGLYTYNKTKQERKKKLRPESEWIRIYNPDWKIIDDATFQKAQEIYKLNQKKHQKSSNRLGTGKISLFGGLIECGVCGYSMTIKYSSTYGRRTFYQCKSYAEDRIGCGNDVVYEDFLEEGVIKLVEQLAQSSKDEIYKYVLEESMSNISDEQLKNIENQEKQIKILIKKYTDEFETFLLKGLTVPDSLREKLVKYEEELRNLEKQKEMILKEKKNREKEFMEWDEFIELLSSLKDILKIASKEDKKMFYKSFIDRISFTKGKVNVFIKGKSFEIEYRPRILDLTEDDIKYLKSINTDRANIILLANQINNRDKIAEKLNVSQHLVDYVITKWKSGRKSVVRRSGEPKQRRLKGFYIVKQFVEENNIDINQISGLELTRLINEKLNLNLSEHSVRSSLYALGKKKNRNF